MNNSHKTAVAGASFLVTIGLGLGLATDAYARDWTFQPPKDRRTAPHHPGSANRPERPIPTYPGSIGNRKTANKVTWTPPTSPRPAPTYTCSVSCR